MKVLMQFSQRVGGIRAVSGNDQMLLESAPAAPSFEAGCQTVGGLNVGITPTFYARRGEYVDLCVVTTYANRGDIATQVMLQVSKESGRIRVVELVEDEAFPLDKELETADNPKK